METTHQFDIAFNTRTSLYEVHASGCKHTTMSAHLDSMTTVTGATGAEAAAEFESRNDGIFCKLGPCAK